MDDPTDYSSLYTAGGLYSNPNGGPPIPAKNANQNTPQTFGQLLGLPAYNQIPVPKYNDPNDVNAFQNSKYYQIATGNGMTPWGSAADDNQTSLAAQQGNIAKSEAQGQAGAAASRLAMQGGLTSGARERIQQQSGKNALSMVQGANQTAANNIANIGISDAQQKQKMLGDANNQLLSMKSQNVTGQNQNNQYISNLMGQIVGADQNFNATMATK